MTHPSSSVENLPKFKVGQVVMMKSLKKPMPFVILDRTNESGEWFYQWNKKNAASEHMLRELTEEEKGTPVTVPGEQKGGTQPEPWEIQCGAQDPDGWCCGLSTGHAGDHDFHASTWPDVFKPKHVAEASPIWEKVKK